ncbi:MAG: hypothetical protein AAGL97_13495 [Pseudomonadota bacterium]
MNLTGCQTAPTQSTLIDCIAAGQVEFNTHQKFVNDLGAEGITPSIELMPYQRMHNAILARYMLNGETPPSEEPFRIYPVPSVEQSIEDAIIVKMAKLSTANFEETEQLNRDCGKILRRNRNLHSE